MDPPPQTPPRYPLQAAATAHLDVMRRYQETCPQCGAPVSNFKIEHDADRVIYTVECSAGHRTTV